MADVSRLKWIMEVDSSRFEAGLKRARRAIVGVGAALGGVGAIRRGAATAERLVQGAGATGIGVEGLQELEFAGGQAGLEPGQTTESLSQFARALGRLRQGKGPLARLRGRSTAGLLRELAGAPGTEAALGVLSAGVAGMPEGIGGAVAEAAGFGGLQGFEFLQQGPAALAQARRRYHTLNRPMSADQAEAIKRGGDIVTELGGAAASGFNQLLGRVALSLDRVAARLEANTRATEDDTRAGARVGP